MAATLFGLSTPLVQRAGTGLGAFTTAALLYAGAAAIGAIVRQPVGREAAVRTSDFKRLALMALFGAAIGPVALAWGLQHSSGAGASVMLAMEALFTAFFAYLLYGEVMDRRVRAAMVLLVAGGVTLVVGSGIADGAQWLGLLAVLGATAAWGMDNSLSRALAERDPGQVVLCKSMLGAAVTGVLALLREEPVPSWGAAFWLLLIGASGYGLSLRLYLLAQRAFGAARTGSVFAFAPFIGALGAIVLGERSLGAGVVAGGILMFLGVVLHLVESHDHEHVHLELEHEHAHAHDDGHHTHAHDPMPSGVHSHLHRHEALNHSHPHVPDAHHAHEH